MTAQPNLFTGTDERLTMAEATELTLQSLQAYGVDHPHWAIAWSGGKDSTATLTLVLHLIASGRLAPPASLTVFYADTRQELPPLAAAAAVTLRRLAVMAPWIRAETVTAPLDKRFLVYILGRGVPPPNNNTLRWCTRQIKVDPMAAALEARLGELPGQVLMITGVRQGESAVRDRRIVMSCSKDGAECGQGWYQQVLPNAAGIRGRIATLAPLLHWRVCHVWDWLRFFAPAPEYGGWPTAMLAEAYGGDEAEEIAARTGCIGCPLASEERALDAILRQEAWAYLAPLTGLKPLYRELRLPKWRIRKAEREFRRDGTPAANPQRMGPITFAGRRMGLARVLAIQAQVNAAAIATDRPLIDILNELEAARIEALIEAETWPQGWAGDEPGADAILDTIYPSGAVQPLLIR